MFDRPDFIALVIAAAVAFHSNSNPLWRQTVLVGASAAFLYSLTGSVKALWPVGLFAAAALSAVFIGARKPRLAMPVFLPALLVLFLILKGYIGPGAGGTAITIGISYMLFRVLQVLSDIADDMIGPDDLEPAAVLLFLTSFLTLAAGPIQRFDDFRRDLGEAGQLTLASLDPAATGGRLILGYVKLVALAPLILNAQQAFVRADVIAPVRLGAAAAVFMIWIYVNFSGYMDVVVSLGRVFGFRLPENFDRPDRAANFLDIWNRWHITLSRTFQIYIFNPVVRFLLDKVVPGRLALAGIMAYAVVFFLIGWWHGPDAKFALSGILLAVCAAVTKMWQTYRPFRTLSSLRAVRQIASSGLGLGACSLALMPTWPLFTSATDVLASLKSPGRVIGALVVASAAGVAVRLTGMSYDWLANSASATGLWRRTVGNPIAVGCLAAMLVIMEWASAGKFSALVYYQRF